MTLRTVYVTGGYADTLEVDLASVADLTTATFKIALTPEAATTPPPINDASWITATGGTGDLAGVLKRAVPTTTTPGRYGVWVQVTFGGITVPVRVLGDDGKPWIVRVV